MKISVNVVKGGALVEKLLEATKALLEGMASNNYHSSSERAIPKRSGGKHEVDVITLLTSRVDALA